ncbi:hypothetical protein COLO4_11258 [Corchorus olitorius]|uniref:Uncharacterized protein n=1 Tax=Corchorus olitorius TaxID=93759 RepID=A0A1R3K593_9ROSI|nr:hypothetical protein COLO4_11258 [Corchorus olitorius]
MVAKIKKYPRTIRNRKAVTTKKTRVNREQQQIR